MVLGICGVASITYAVSAIFIFYLSDFVGDSLGVNEDLFILITLILGVVWCGIFGFVGATMIIKPIVALEKAAKKIATGNLKENVHVPKSRDELQALAIVFNQMIERLRGMVNDINTNFEQTNMNVVEIKAASDTAAGQAELISRNIEEIAKGAEESACAVQNTAASMDGVTQIASRVQANAEKSNRQSDEMLMILSESKDVIQSLVTGIQKLAANNETSLSRVHQLELHARKIGEILSLVAEISEQTNLLALNASIEAARAGEHGKGFAVVADEVRKLADESRRAVQGIAELITNIQTEVKNVVEQITYQVEIAKTEAEKGEKTNAAMMKISGSVDDVVVSIREILQLVEEQMQTIEATAKESQEVAAIAEETSAGAQEVSSAIEEQTAIMEQIASAGEVLSRCASDLQKTIARFSV
ncbi:methyl-accepting chemotaxis protein [Evansella caseinilytica]|uniref:Methyl-accepting chemotaxis protein n=1 Tax=Evansella caseinilytica TaxID=1503961 RepID=A0A1H3T6G8_9BACI|nr:methyl-accepting chemotaxis protein [Evansella caseinilytica]